MRLLPSRHFPCTDADSCIARVRTTERYDEHLPISGFPVSKQQLLARLFSHVVFAWFSFCDCRGYSPYEPHYKEFGKKPRRQSQPMMATRYRQL